MHLMHKKSRLFFWVTRYIKETVKLDRSCQNKDIVIRDTDVYVSVIALKKCILVHYLSMQKVLANFAQLTKVPLNVSWPFFEKFQTGFRTIFKLLPKS